MKVKVNGQGKILTPEELRVLFTDGLTNPRDRAMECHLLIHWLSSVRSVGTQHHGYKKRNVNFQKVYHQREAQNPRCGYSARISCIFGGTSTKT